MKRKTPQQKLAEVLRHTARAVHSAKCLPCVCASLPFKIVTQNYKENCDFTIFERAKSEVFTNEVFDFLDDLYSPKARKALQQNEMLFTVVYHFIIEIIALKKTIFHF